MSKLHPKWTPDGWDEELEVRKARVHDKECEVAALAVIKERTRLRPTERKATPANISSRPQP